jgi:hypothetical protein
MTSFGNSTAAGRRLAPRRDAPICAVLSSATTHYSAELVDISRTGARLRSLKFPRCGEDVVFQAEKVRAAAEVIWLEDDECALEFDTPIAAGEVNRIRALANFIAIVSGDAGR